MFHRDNEAATEQAMLAALTAQGVPTENARIDVQKVADGYARVAEPELVTLDPNLADAVPSMTIIDQSRRHAPLPAYQHPSKV